MSTSVKRLATWVTGSVAILITLDVTTSLFPSFIDAQMRVLAPRGGLVWWTEVVIALGCAVWFLWKSPSIWRWWVDLPTPPLPKALLTLFVLITLVHIALRTEHYPFSNVGMFSQAVPDGHLKARYEARPTLILPSAEGPTPISFMQESSLYWSTLGLDIDAKTGWLMLFYAAELERAYQDAAVQVMALGHPPPRRCKMSFDRGSGAVHRIRCQPQPEAPR